ncbi:HAD-IIA family hydrolase [Nocardioides sp.]|uniref:HAD-IIA family hydrolase n=1 Tax=Nocardioides sp. TaxID=35761 RepID=UPI003513A52D
MLRESRAPLRSEVDLVMLDLDGVVYVGAAAVPGAAEHLAVARAHGVRCAFVTNNASRTPDTVAAHLTELGVPAGRDDVVTSAQAAARLVREDVGEGGRVVVLGGEGLHAAVAEAGLQGVGVGEDAAVVVTGYGPDVVWRDIMRAAVRIRAGDRWVASNTDTTIPTADGVAPGHGALVALIREFTGVEPRVAGKPARPLLDETVRRVGGTRPLMVGDRLDTDILGGRAAGVRTLLVLTGVTDLAGLVAAPPELRPDHLGTDLGALHRSHPAPVLTDRGAHCGVWRAEVVDGRVLVAAQPGTPPGTGRAADPVADPAADPDDWWRAVATAAWDHLDRTGTAAVVDHLEPPAPLTPPAMP